MAEIKTEVRKTWRNGSLVVERTTVEEVMVIDGPQGVIGEFLLDMVSQLAKVPPNVLQEGKYKTLLEPVIRLKSDQICEALRKAGFLDTPPLPSADNR